MFFKSNHIVKGVIFISHCVTKGSSKSTALKNEPETVNTRVLKFSVLNKTI